MTTIAIAVMAAMISVPYARTLERSRWRAARDVLEAIYSGERVYWTMNNDLYCPVPGTCTWDQIFVDNPTGAIPGVTFAVTTAGGNTTFTATATRPGTPLCVAGWQTTINENRAPGGPNPTAANVCP